MSFINHAAKEIHVKLVYYGPGIGGKTTNVRYIHQKTRKANTGTLLELNTESERTLFFDFLPIWLGTVHGFRVRIHLYTVPGQIFYKASRALILRGMDSVVFVADSSPDRMYANLESMTDLADNLSLMDRDIAQVPLILQANKRDVRDASPMRDMCELVPVGTPVLPASAIIGQGVFETFKAACKLSIRALLRDPIQATSTHINAVERYRAISLESLVRCRQATRKKMRKEAEKNSASAEAERSATRKRYECFY